MAPNQSSLNGPDFVTTLYNQGLISSRIIAFGLELAEGSDIKVGYMDVGAIDETAIVPGTFTEYPLAPTTNGLWTLPLKNVTLVGNPVIAGSNGLLAITLNSEYNIVPQQVFDTIVTQLGYAGATRVTSGNIVTLSTAACPPDIATLPVIQYSIDGQLLELPRAQYFRTASSQCFLYFGYFSNPALNLLGPGINYTLGYRMLRNSYTVFDFDQRKVGRGELITA